MIHSCINRKSGLYIFQDIKFPDKYIFNLKNEYYILIIYFFSQKNKCLSDKKYSIIFAENQQEVKRNAGILQTSAIEKDRVYQIKK